MPATISTAGLPLHRPVGRHAHRLLRGHRPHAGEPGHRVPRRLVPRVLVDQDARPAQVHQRHAQARRRQGGQRLLQVAVDHQAQQGRAPRRDRQPAQREPRAGDDLEDAQRLPGQGRRAATQGQRQRGRDRVDRDRPRRASNCRTSDGRATFTLRVGFHFKVEVLGLAPRRRRPALHRGRRARGRGGHRRGGRRRREPLRAALSRCAPKYADLVLKRGLLQKSARSGTGRAQCIEDLDDRSPRTST